MYNDYYVILYYVALYYSITYHTIVYHITVWHDRVCKGRGWTLLGLEKLIKIIFKRNLLYLLLFCCLFGICISTYLYIYIYIVLSTSIILVWHVGFVTGSGNAQNHHHWKFRAFIWNRR